MKKQWYFWLFVVSFIPFNVVIANSGYQKITFPSADQLTITADLYMPYSNSTPFIILFHQAGYSRGEYREIAPRLNNLGFNVMAIDQRSGNEVNGVVNETAASAEANNLSTTYLDALQDLNAAIDYAKQNYVQGKLIIWGSSYSSSLVLKLAGETSDLVDAVLSFSPGEYFTHLGKSATYIQNSAKNIIVPVFITSAKSEKDDWYSIYQGIQSSSKTFFLPEVNEGRHGSGTLWESIVGNQEYWQATENFLAQFLDDSSCSAIFSASSAELEIPCVRVEESFYAAKLPLIEGTWDFQLDLNQVTPISAIVDSCSSTFNAAIGTLSIPCVSVDNSNYSVELSYNSTTMTFTLLLESVKVVP